ncbi:hypothetical protein FRC08_008516 [Ceratobasidium sp. 394]|nr:hypothetical protein FRC08_008516 [Ceratobasidium sp. 394]
MSPKEEKKKGWKVKKASEETPLAGSSEENDSPTPLDSLDFPSLKEEETLPCVNDKELHDRCIAVLDTLGDQELDFGLFVWAVNWGNNASHDNLSMQQAQTSFRGKYLISTLHNVQIPPCMGSKGSCPKGAQKQIDNFALGLIGQ